MADKERSPEELRWQHIQEKMEELRNLLNEAASKEYAYLLFIHHLQDGAALSSMYGDLKEIGNIVGWLAEQFGGIGFKMALVIELAEQLRRQRAQIMFDLMKDDPVTH